MDYFERRRHLVFLCFYRGFQLSNTTSSRVLSFSSKTSPDWGIDIWREEVSLWVTSSFLILILMVIDWLFFCFLFSYSIQSDICHQSVYELVHSEDREELQRHLMWNSHLPSDRSNTSVQEGLLPENWSFLERNFTVRFRCLLDNTSGFLVREWITW